jgi:hypothetical protein
VFHRLLREVAEQETERINHIVLWTRELHSLTHELEAWLDDRNKLMFGNELSLTDCVLAALNFSFLENRHSKADRMRKFA